MRKRSNPLGQVILRVTQFVMASLLLLGIWVLMSLSIVAETVVE